MYKFLEELYIAFLEKRVLKLAEKYGFDVSGGTHNNEGDAVKHCLMQAELSLWLGYKLAEKIGIKHEDDNPYNTDEERIMDLFNNMKGREVCKEIKTPFWFLNIKKTYDKMIELIIKKLNNGELITHP